MTTTAIAPVEEVVPMQEETGYQLVALDRPQLEAAHAKMVEWAVQQGQSCEAERAENQANLDIAASRRWATAPFKNRIRVLEQRKIFYAKIEAALRAGYVIVPNFQMEVFAIRTKANAPRRRIESTTLSWSQPDFTQQAQNLPEGEGEYRNPRVGGQLLDTEVTKSATGREDKTYIYSPADDFSEIGFPVVLAKPMLMSKTAEVMAQRLFDEVGVAVDTQTRTGFRRGDPILLGRLRNPRKTHPDMTFFLGWYFDPSNI